MESSSRTLVCSVLFLDIVEYSKKAVADQIQLKQSFNQVLAKALDEVPARDRIILDTGDGAAVTFMGDPEDALFTAMSVRETAGTLPVRMGVNLGPVRLVKDLNGQMNIIGDGINVAQRVMSFSRPGQLLVSRSFYEVVSCLSRDYMNMFRHEGSRTDKHVREHEVYSVIGGAPAARRVAESAMEITGGSTFAGWLAGTGPVGLRRTALLAAPALFFAVVGAAMAVSAMLDSGAASPANPNSAGAKFVGAEPASPAGRSADKATIAVRKQLAARIERKLAEKRQEKMAAQADPGRLELAIAPWGKVFVDGHERGVSPPLTVLDISAGSHTIVIHNADFPPHVERVVIKTGEATRIRHRFR
jgi:class 3 adenylate cyclase